MQARTLRAGLAAATLALSSSAPAALIEGQFLPEQPPVSGVAANGGAGTLTISGAQYPLPAELNPVAATTIGLSPGRQLVVSHRTPEVTDICSGSSVQHMYHRIPTNPGEPLPLIQTVCLTEPRAFQGHYEQPGLSSQQVAALRERTPLTAFDQRISFVRLDTTPGVVASQLYAEDVESVQFSPSGTVGLVKYDLPGGDLDPADYRFIDLCPATFGNQLANFPNVGAGAQAAVENDGSGGFRVRFAHPSFVGGATTFPIVDCLSSPPPPPPGEQPLRVTLTGNGSGRVTSNPIGINCPAAACQSNFAENSSVFLTATADAGSTFAGWTGDCGGTQASVSVTVDAARECQATFTRPAADLGLTCSGPTQVVAGDRWEVRFDVSNSGPDQASSTQFSVPAVPGLALVANESSSSCFAFSDGSVACNLFQVPANENVRLDLVYDVDPFARGSVAVEGSVTNSRTDPVAGNNACSLATDLTVDVDLDLSKAADPDPVGAGELLIYQLDVRNSGRSGALGVEISDSLPPEVTPVSPASAGVCSVGEVAPDAVVTATLITRVNEGLANGTVISNTATVATSDPDPNLANNTDSESVTVGVGASPPGTTFRQIDREFENGRTNHAVPSQSGANTAFFANTGNGDPGIYVSIDGRTTVEAYGSRRSIPGFGGSYVNIGLGLGSPAVEGLATAWSGQYFADAGILSSLVSLADGCVARGLFDETVLENDAAAVPSLVVTDLQLRGGRLAFVSQFARVVGIREPDGSFNLLVRSDTQLPARGGPRAMGEVASVAFDGGDVAFSVAAECGQSIPECAYQGIFIAGAGGLSRVADTGTPIPGGSGSFRGFGFQPNTMSMHNNQLAFLGYDSERRAGIYLFDGSTITELVGPSTLIPGTSEVFVTEGVGDSGAVLSLSAPALKNGVVAFVGGNFGAGITGLWTIREGQITPVIRVGELLNGDRVDLLDVGPEGLGVDRLAFLARVANGQSAGSNDAVFTTAVDTTLLFANGFE